MSSLDVAINAPEGLAADEWRVYIRPATGEGDPWTLRGSTRAQSFRLDAMPSSGRIEVAVAPMLGGVEYDPDWWSVSTVDMSDITDFPVPAAVTGLGVAQSGPMLVFVWRPVEVAHLSHYELRMGSSWDTALWIADIPAPATSFTIGWMGSGSKTYLLRAVTAQGAKSATSASATITIREETDQVQIGTTSEHTAFSATKTGCEVSSNQLRPIEYDDQSTMSATYTTYTQPWYYPCTKRPTYVTAAVDEGAVVDEKLEIGLTYTPDQLDADHEEWTFLVVPPTDDDGNALDPGGRTPGSRCTTDGYPVDGVRLRIEIDTAQDGVPTWDGYREWIPGTTYRFRQYRLRLTWLNEWPWTRAKIDTFSHRRTRRNLKDEAEVTVVATGGTDVLWARPFQSAPSVTATVVATTANYATVSNVSSTGCKVRAFDSAGVELSAATVHVVAAGT